MPPSRLALRSFVVAAVGAYWTLMGFYREHARLFLRMGVIVGLIASVLQLFPTGDEHGKLVARYQRPSLAAMEGILAMALALSPCL